VNNPQGQPSKKRGHQGLVAGTWCGDRKKVRAAVWPNLRTFPGYESPSREEGRKRRGGEGHVGKRKRTPKGPGDTPLEAKGGGG